MTWKWYLTIAAIKQYMALAGLSGELEEDNPDFIRAQNELGAYSLMARPVIGKDTESGAVIYRTGKVKLNGKSGVGPRRKERRKCTMYAMPTLQAVSEWQHLCHAKNAACRLSMNGEIYFVCDRQGNVVAGYGSTSDSEKRNFRESPCDYLHD